MKVHCVYDPQNNVIVKMSSKISNLFFGPLLSVPNLAISFFIGESRQLDLGSGLFIGGLPWQRFVNEKFSVSIWSGVLKRGFVGCIRELILNDEPVDVVRYAEEQDIGE